MRRTVSAALTRHPKSDAEIEEEKRKQILLDYMYLQAKTPSTKYNNMILCTFKIIQTLSSVVCLVVHINAYVGRSLPMPHNTLFCATYMGYAIVSSGLIIGYVVGRRASPVMDLCICLMGGIMYNISGVLSLVYAKQLPYKLIDGEFVLHKGFLTRCVVQSVLSSFSALMYWIDFFINLDIYQGMRRRRRSVALDDVINTLDDVESDDFEDVVAYAVDSMGPEKEDEPMTPWQRSVSRNLLSLIQEEEAEQERRTKKTLITEDDDLELHCICIEGSRFCRSVMAPLLKRETYRGKFRRRAPDPEFEIEEFLAMDQYYREHDARFNAYLRQSTGSVAQMYYSDSKMYI